MPYPQGSINSTRPIEIFQIVYGRAVNSIMRFTDAPVPVIVDGETYAPLEITRNSAKVEGNGQQSNIQLTVPLDCELASLFVQFPPNVVVGLAIYAGQMPTVPGTAQALADFSPQWAGIISESNREGSEATLECKTPVSDLEMPGLQRFYSWTCGHPLYGTRCAASRAMAATSNVVAGINAGRNRISFVAGAAWRKAGTNPEDYIGGYIEWTGEQGADFASISNANDTLVDLLGPIRGLDIGDDVTVYLGCARTLENCIRLHDNAVNYGGQPWIPTENPIRERGF